MRHDFVLDGAVFRLRPVCDADAAFMLGLRNDAELQRYLHPGAKTVDEQIEWLAEYYDRNGDYCFVIERMVKNSMEGMIALYDIDENNRSGYMGRWVIKKGSLAAIESAWLVYCFGFEILKLEFIYTRTVADNAAVVSFHDSCNIADRRVLPEYFHFCGRKYDAIEHRIYRADWASISQQMEMSSKRLANRLLHY